MKKGDIHPIMVKKIVDNIIHPTAASMEAIDGNENTINRATPRIKNSEIKLFVPAVLPNS
jgi:hypothetical protein